ncbi:MAG: O-antigen ligase family protein [Pirellulales bacterium]|nr:O-antigen ligase family protein [Pirellulales bacterium]
MNSIRYLSVIFVSFLVLSFIGCEWTWGYSGGGYFWLRAASRVLPALAFLVAGLAAGTFVPRSGRALAIGACLFIPAAVYIMHLAGLSEEYWNVDLRETILLILQAVLSGFVGYSLGKDEREVKWSLECLAVIFAVVAWYKVFIKLTGIGGELSALQPAWPASIVLVFGYSWYLNDFLTRSRPRIWTLFALGGLCMAVLGDFHKPIIFVTLVCTVILFFVAARASSYFRVFYRMAAVGVAGIIFFAVADVVTQRRISTRMADLIETKFLHQDYGKEVTTPWEIIERAAGNRFKIWEQAYHHFIDEPFFGKGPGVRYEATGQQRLSLDDHQAPLHNVYFEILVSVGLVGFLPYFVGIIWWYRLMLKKAVLRRVGFSLAPCTAFVTGLLAFGLIGELGVYFAADSLLLFIMGLTAAVADQALKAARSTVNAVAPKPIVPSNSPLRSGMVHPLPRKKPI